MENVAGLLAGAWRGRCGGQPQTSGRDGVPCPRAARLMFGHGGPSSLPPRVREVARGVVCLLPTARRLWDDQGDSRNRGPGRPRPRVGEGWCQHARGKKKRTQNASIFFATKETIYLEYALLVQIRRLSRLRPGGVIGDHEQLSGHREGRGPRPRGGRAARALKPETERSFAGLYSE